MSLMVIIHRKDGRVLLKTDYSKEFVGALKEAIPYSERDWDKDLKGWAINRPAFRAAQSLLCRFFDNVIETWAAPVVEKVVRQDQDDRGDWAKLHLRPGAPKRVVDAAYKALCLMHHPDRGGSNDRMSEINRAYESLKGAL